MLCIMAGMDQRDSYLVRVWRWHVQCCPRAVFPSLSSGPRCPSSWPAWTTAQFGGSQVQFLDKVFYMPVVVLRVVPRSRQCSTLFGGSAVTVHHGHLIPVVAQRPSPWLRLFSRPLRFHCCRFDVSVVQDRQVRWVQAWRRQPCPTLLSFAGADVENTFEIPQLQLVDAGLRTRLAGSTGAVCEETVDIPLLLLHAGFAVH